MMSSFDRRFGDAIRPRLAEYRVHDQVIKSFEAAWDALNVPDELRDWLRLATMSLASTAAGSPVGSYIREIHGPDSCQQPTSIGHTEGVWLCRRWIQDVLKAEAEACLQQEESQRAARFRAYCWQRIDNVINAGLLSVGEVDQIAEEICENAGYPPFDQWKPNDRDLRLAIHPANAYASDALDDLRSPIRIIRGNGADDPRAVALILGQDKSARFEPPGSTPLPAQLAGVLLGSVIPEEFRSRLNLLVNPGTAEPLASISITPFEARTLAREWSKVVLAALETWYVAPGSATITIQLPAQGLFRIEALIEAKLMHWEELHGIASLLALDRELLPWSRADRIIRKSAKAVSNMTRVCGAQEDLAQ